MKIRSKAFAIVCFLAVVLSAVIVVYSGCSKKVTLDAPSDLQINEKVLIWSKVENASGYMVDIDGKQTLSGENSFNLSALNEFETYVIKVRALGDGEEYESSKWSDSKEYTPQPEEEEESLSYAYIDMNDIFGISGLMVTGIGTVTSDEVVIPPSRYGEPVVAIYNSAFDSNKKIKKVILPDTIIKIMAEAFIDCRSLEYINLADCTRLNEIQKAAFFGCLSLKTVELPDSITFISDYDYNIFAHCISLEYVKLPSKLTDFNGNWFTDTPRLKSLTLPDTLTVLGAEALGGTSIESIKIPESVTVIGDYAFRGSAIKSLEIPKNVTEIGNYAFSKTPIETIKIPKNVTKIGNYAFKESAIKRIELEEGCKLTELGDFVFESCNNLESFVIPPSVTTIGADPFMGCKNIKSVTFEKNSNLKRLPVLPSGSEITEFIIPNTIEEISNSAFSGLTKLRKVIIEDNSELKALPNSCFSDCSSLITVDFGKNSKIKTIKSGAFRNCSKLTAIDIPESVTSIAACAFYNCTSISSVVIPVGVVNIGVRAFYGWTPDQTIYIVGRTEAPDDWDPDWYEGSTATVVWGYEQK
ncbi:MAG TPA: hypothetical protein DHU65_06820 [Clostridiales bacterium]|nr:hypothetical protein [Clostridiales bacterium]